MSFIFQKNKNKNKIKVKWYFLLGIIALFLIKAFVFEVVFIPSSSMFPTLRDGDYVFINKFVNKHKSIKHGDIITFHKKGTKEIFIKRVIALAGDLVEIKNDQVLLNGRLLKHREFQLRVTLPIEISMRHFDAYEEEGGSKKYSIIIDEDKISKNMKAITITEGHLFVMGDNRNHSIDSRDFGLISYEQVIGKAKGILINWSTDFKLFKPI